MSNRSIRQRLIAAVGEEWADAIGDAVAGWLVRGGYLSMASKQSSGLKAAPSIAEQVVPHDRPDQSVRAELRRGAVAWCRLDDFQNAAIKRQSFSGWREQHSDCTMPLFAAPPAPVPPAEGEARNLPHYTEDVCSEEESIRWAAGAVILRDGVKMPIERIVSELNRLTALIAEFRPVPVSERLPWPEDCIRWGDDDWCWGQERSQRHLLMALTGPAAARWRLMRVSSLEDEAVNWLPAGALPLPADWEGSL